VPGTRARSTRRHICILHKFNQLCKWERKTGKKHSFSDGKRFTDFVLLRCFIDFQTTLVDSGNLVIFSAFW
jgi:hypothetical protein